jgi:hypothetical protein
MIKKRSGEKHVSTPYDVPRTLRMAAVGMFLSGPLLHVWYKVLDKWMAGPNTKALLFKYVILFLSSRSLQLMPLSGKSQLINSYILQSRLRVCFYPKTWDHLVNNF